MASKDGACNFKSLKEEETEEKQTFRYRNVASKAQMCLHKILHIITTIPRPPPPLPPRLPSAPPTAAAAAPSTQNQDHPSISNASESKRGVDLNLTLLSTKASQRNLESPTTDSFVVSAAEESLSGGKCNNISGLSHDNNKSLELLFEAAKVVFGCEFEELEKKVSRNGRLSESTRLLPRRCPPYWKNEVDEDYVAAVEDDDDVMLSPVVRSKRGRTRVLPYRFRDSVVEPLTRLSRPNRPLNAVRTNRRSTSSRSFFI